MPEESAPQDFLRKIPPQNANAEMAVLGGVFLKGSIFHSLVDLLGEDDFYSSTHRIIFNAFKDLYAANTPVDLVTVADYLKKQGKLQEVGGHAYLADIASAVVSASNAMAYARIVKENSVKRQLINAGMEIIRESFESAEDAESIVDKAQQAVFKVAEQHAAQDYSASKDLVQSVFEQLEKRAASRDLITGVTTGFSRLNEMTAGLQPTDLIILAARPSMGKTAFALSMAYNAATNGVQDVPTAIFSLEMSKEQLMQRLMCIAGDVDLKRLRTGQLDDDDWNKLYTAGDILTSAPLFIDDTPALSVMELRARCRRLKMERGLGLILVDYLQLMRAGKRIDSREQEISEISRNLKALAKELDVPVVALSQLNRKVEERADRRPMLSDLRESGAIEQDADIIMFIYRDEVYNKESPKKGVANIIIGKQRNGPVGELELAFIGHCTKFADLSYSQPSEYGVSG
ncbi:MAG: replicative DNA helicase [Desulfovibrio sp.]|uniref:replicative DNA helicase n=1 Tax=Desulfovibrio sp. 7SRBS1 TaxID=3378064 RepID=UPI003B418A19